MCDACRTGEAITDERAFAPSLLSPGVEPGHHGSTPSPSPAAALSPASAGPDTAGMHHVHSEAAFTAPASMSPTSSPDEAVVAASCGPTGEAGTAPASARAALLASVTGIGSSGTGTPSSGTGTTSGANGVPHDDGHVVVPPHIERALASITSPQMSVSTQAALLSFGRAVGTAMHRAPLPTFFPVFTRDATPVMQVSGAVVGGVSAAGSASSAASSGVVLAGRAGTPPVRSGATPTSRGSVTGGIRAHSGRGSVTSTLPVTALLSPTASAGDAAGSGPAGSAGMKRVGSRSSVTAGGDSAGGAGAMPTAPSHVDVFVHGHHVTRPRLGTAVDVVSEHTASTVGQGTADAPHAPAVAAPGATAPAVHTSAVVGGSHGAHAFHPYVHRLPAITDVDETLSSPPLRARGSSAGEPPDATALPPPALPVVAEGKAVGAEEPDTPILSAAHIHDGGALHLDNGAGAAPPAAADSQLPASASAVAVADGHVAPAAPPTAAPTGPTLPTDGAAIVHHHSHHNPHHHPHHRHHATSSRRRDVDKAGHAMRKGRHLAALQLLGVGNVAETVFLWLVAAFGVAVLVLTTVQSVQEAAGAVASSEPAFCRGG